MKKGDLVKRKPEWGNWVKHNPWMLSEKDLEIGIIIEADVDLVVVLWPSHGTGWIGKDDLEKINDEFIKKNTMRPKVSGLMGECTTTQRNNRR